MATRSSAGKKSVSKSRSPKPGSRATARPATIADLRRIARAIVTSTTVNDEKRMLSLYDDSIESIEMGQPPVRGIEGLKKKFEGWNKMTSSQNWRARNLWVDGQTIIVEWEGTVTLRSSGKKVAMNELAVHEIRGGKIVRERFFYDPRTLG